MEKIADGGNTNQARDTAQVAAASLAALPTQTVCEAIDASIAQHNRDITHLLKLRDSLPLNVLAMPAFQLRHIGQRI